MVFVAELLGQLLVVAASVVLESGRMIPKRVYFLVSQLPDQLFHRQVGVVRKLDILLYSEQVMSRN